MNQIMKEGILAAIPPDEPIVFCGDLNAGDNSPVHKLLSSRLQDAGQIRPHMAPEPTFYSSLPLLRLDHIFHSHHFTPVQVEVARDWECRLASDHLPVLATLALRS